MNVETLLRAVAAAGAVLLAGRAEGRVPPSAARVIAGAAAAFAVCGGTRTLFPGPTEAAALAGALALLLALGTGRGFSPITEEAAGAAALLAGGAAAEALVAARRLAAVEAAGCAVLAVLAVSAFGAEACRAGGEAGWREGLSRALCVLLPAALAASLSASVAAVGRASAWGVLAAGVALAIGVWGPAIVAERARVRDELAEEVALGLLPAEDAAALRLPWTRCFEKRFGRPDERREYVRSALLLAGARHQQRRRTGEAERLRQLEVLTFRTRLRRTQEARAARFARSESGEFGRDDA